MQNEVIKTAYFITFFDILYRFRTNRKKPNRFILYFINFSLFCLIYVQNAKHLDIALSGRRRRHLYDSVWGPKAVRNPPPPQRQRDNLNNDARVSDIHGWLSLLKFLREGGGGPQGTIVFCIKYL